MATSIFTHATADDRNRLELARIAGGEIYAIASVLDLLIERDALDQVDTLWRGLRLRLFALSSVVMSAVDDDVEPTEDIARAVFEGRGAHFDAAKWLGLQTEVAHG